MAAWFRVVVAVIVLALLPVYFATTAFADDPTPKPTLHYVEAPLDRPPGSIDKETSRAGTTETTTEPSLKNSDLNAAPQAGTPAPQTTESVKPPHLAQTGGSRDIWLPGFSLLCIWVGCAVATYGRERNLKR